MEIKTGKLKDQLGAISQEAGEQLISVLSTLAQPGSNPKVDGISGKITKLQNVKVRDDNDNWFYLTGEVAENFTQLIGREEGIDEIHYLTIVELDAYQIVELLDYLKD